MKTFLLVFLVAAACTKPNPNRCCTDEADCMAQGLPTGSTCDEGLLCRGGQCIAQTCSTANDCDASAPFCIDASCTEMCTADDQCPGFGGDASRMYCETGACVQCRAGSNADCGGATPVCATGACRACAAHSECTSGVCGVDGSCVGEAAIAYVDVTGSQAADCTKSSPCSTVPRALQVGREFILIGSGTYSAPSALNLNGQHSLIGRGATQPVLSRSTAGSVITISTGELTLENLTIRDGTPTTGDDYGAGVSCTSVGGAPAVHLKAVTLTQNQTGLRGQNCSIDAVACSLVSNSAGAMLSDSTASFDRCLVTSNEIGLSLDGGQYAVTNTFIVRNSPPSTSAALDLFTSQNGTKVEFNTIADNAGLGFRCGLQNVSGAFPSNIVARNTSQTSGLNCSYPSSIILDTDVSAVRFASPDISPYDYHLTANSIAIDAATVSTNAHDFDGDARPQGAARDVGADEFKP